MVQHEEYSFQVEEVILLQCPTRGHCEPMALVNIRVKVIDVGETEMVSQKKLKMAESIISEGENNASYVFEKLRETTGGTFKSYVFERLGETTKKLPKNKVYHKKIYRKCALKVRVL